MMPNLTGVGNNSVYIDTLGCKVNYFESEYIYDQLSARNWEKAQNKNASLCIINTCTVTKEADRRSRQVIRRTVRNYPGSKIIVTGCYAEMNPKECEAIPGVDLVIPGTQKLSIPTLVSNHFESIATKGSEILSKPAKFPTEIIGGFESRTRAFLQIQQGCDNGCTFCIIHKARGPSRSVLPTTVIQQFEHYVRQGFREIVICGIDLGSYGDDLSAAASKPLDLAILLDELASRYPNCRIRLSSIDPCHITLNLIEVLANHHNICPHIHLSLQSAAPIILKKMKRRYSVDDVYRVVDQLYEARRSMVFSADIMAGFPTESDEDFEDTKAAIEQLKIAYPHVFVYSERDGTPAARIGKQVPMKVRKQRAKLLRDTGVKVRRKVLENYVGQTVETLVEGPIKKESTEFRARMNNFIPVYFKQVKSLNQPFAQMKVVGPMRDGLRGELVL